MNDSAISSISYSGYLLKRSNHPLSKAPLFPIDPNPLQTSTAITTSLFPDDNNNQFLGGIDGEGAIHDYAALEHDHDSTFLEEDDEERAAHSPHMPLHFQEGGFASESEEKPDVLLAQGETSTAQQQETEETLKVNGLDKNDDGVGLAFFASLFGIEMPIQKHFYQSTINNNNTEAEQLQQHQVDPLSPIAAETGLLFRKSSPIKVGGTGSTKSLFRLQDSPQSISPRSPEMSGLTSAQCAPNLQEQSSSSPDAKPSDYIDPVDGHIWRAKYCVLEYETLFFYRNQTVAESSKAVKERQQFQYNADTTETLDLSMSPMPKFQRQVMRSADDVDDHATVPAGALYEKRVALEQVGAVRSAEVEHGPHSFELTAGDDVSDKLVLRARNGEEMNEWLFKFHRCIASFVMDMMDHVAIPIDSPFRAQIGDIHHPTFQAYKVPDRADVEKPVSTSFIDTSSPIRRGRSLTTAPLATCSPRYHSILTAAAAAGSASSRASLSHGHGRNSLHRRREAGRSSSIRQTASEDLSPTVPFPLDQQRPKHKGSNLSALHYSPPNFAAVVFPPSSHETAAAAAARPDTEPEIIASPKEHPETEHPPSNQGGKYVPPHLRVKAGSIGGKKAPTHLRKPNAKYIPQHMRNSTSSSVTSTTAPSGATPDRYVPRHLRSREADGTSTTVELSGSSMMTSGSADSTAIVEEVTGSNLFIKLGGCADPADVTGSILDDQFIPRKASRLEKKTTQPFGYYSSDDDEDGSKKETGRRRRLRWEIGAFSECGIRESNEDAYLVTSNLVEAFTSVDAEHTAETVWSRCIDSHPPGLFAIFDGHCGDQASRFAAERLTPFIYEESLMSNSGNADTDVTKQTENLVEILDRAIHRLDDEFCNVCVEGERQWESGSTALIVALANEQLIVANLGDARGIVGRSVASGEDSAEHEERGWNELPFDDYTGDRRCLWKEVTDVHSPNRDDERARIQKAGGWVTEEREIPVGQIKRLALYDGDVVDILKRCFADRYQPSPKASAPHRFLKISRVCGELAVSRALGDRDFKASHNIPESKASLNGRTSRAVAETLQWDPSHLFLSYPEGHNQFFVGDLVTNKPDFQAVRVGEEGVSEEFLLLACDGLWDVIDADDAYRVTRDLLFEKQWSAKKAAGRLAELAVHLGSSDNITVIVVRFFDR